MSKIRIMELRGTYKGGGGPDKTILLSAQRHQKDKFFILVTYLRSPDDKDFQIGIKAKELGISNYIEVIDKSVIDLNCLFELNALIKKYKIQIVHVHDLKTTFLGVLLKLLNRKVKIMHTAHGWIINTKLDKVKQQLQFFWLKFYPLHIAVSKATRNILIKNGISGRKIKTLYNGIDIDYWKKNNSISTIREEFDISKDIPLIGTIGRICKEKDLNTFLKVAINVLKEFPHACFIVVGDGLEHEVLNFKSSISRMELNNSIIFTGHRNDLKNIYSGLDIFLLTSLTEGLPNTVLEAMAMEVPVVATGVGGVPELIIDGKTGCLHKPGDIEKIAGDIIDLLKHENKKISLYTNARTRIEQIFSFKRRLIKIEEYYNDFNSRNSIK